LIFKVAVRILLLLRRFAVTEMAVVVILRACENTEDHNERPLGVGMPSGQDVRDPVGVERPPERHRKQQRSTPLARRQTLHSRHTKAKEAHKITSNYKLRPCLRWSGVDGVAA
jgi:hypothetical protein